MTLCRASAEASGSCERARLGVTLSLTLLSFAGVWLAQLSMTSLSPPTDNIEQLTWVRSLEWGYYKHPPLPTWLIWLPSRLLGISAWTSYLTGAAFILGSAIVLWHLLFRLRGRNYATLGLLAVLCITYYNGRLYYYNHNVVLMFFATVSASLCWKAYSTGQSRWWIALGAALGLGALAKYQIAVTVTCLLAFWLQRRAWRDPRQRRGLLAAMLVALLIFVPHLQWLQAHDFGPIQYALESSLGAHLGTAARWEDSSHWLIDQLFNRALPAWLLLAAAVRYGGADTVTRRGRVMQPAPFFFGRQADAGRALLLSWGLVPLIFMPISGLATGADLQLQWGTPFLLFAVPAAMEVFGALIDWRQLSLRPAAKAFLFLQMLLLLLSHLTSFRGPEPLRNHHWRDFDGDGLAKALEAPASQALRGGPICVVSGPAAPAGALALRLTDRPLVLIDGRYDRSPWVGPELVQTCGMLELHSKDAAHNAVIKGFPELSWRVVPPESESIAGWNQQPTQPVMPESFPLAAGP